MKGPVRLLIASVPPPGTVIDDLLQSVGPAPRRVIAVLGDSLIQRRRLTDLPPARRSIARRLAQRHSARYFRLRDGGIVIDLVPETSSRGGTAWLAAAAPAEFVDLLLATATRLGYEVVDVVPDAKNGWSGLSFLPTTEQRRRLKHHWKETARIALAVLLVVTMVWIVSFTMRLRAVQQLSVGLSSVDSVVAVVSDARAAYGVLHELTTTMQQAQGDRHKLGALMAAMVRALPDSAVLTMLTLDLSGVGRLSGFAEEALAVNAALHRVPGLADFQLEGVPVVEAVGGRSWMRFALRSVQP